MATSTKFSPTPKRPDNMALIFQEVLTVIARLRAERQRMGDLRAFRTHICNALKTAETEGARLGYAREDLHVAMFAVVAFLDESIPKSEGSIYNVWQATPLQEELFGVRNGGEIFFGNVERLMGREDSGTLADLLEVHQHCLLLGFRGTGSTEEPPAHARLGERIRGIRGAAQPLAWRPTALRMRAKPDKWTPALRWAAIGCAGLAVVLFLVFRVSLAFRLAELNSIASRAMF